MSTELKDCPFCGGAARIESNRDWHRLFCAHDDDCVLDADDHDLMYPAQPGYLKEIAEVWNRRASPAAAVPDDTLPPLPKGFRADEFMYNTIVYGYDELCQAQREGYAAGRAAVEADRAQREQEDVEEESAADGWRRLALQFDGHRMQALHHLRAMLQDPAKHAPHATEFLSAGPLSGEEVLAQRIAALADRAQQGEPVDGDAIAKSKRILSLVDDYTIARETGDNEKARDVRTNLRCALMDEFESRAATKAAAPADATQQQEMVVRVAPAPAGQHDAGGADMVALHNAIMNLPCTRTMSHFATQHEMRAYKEGHRDARHAAAELASEATSRAQRTTIDKPNSAAPVSSTATAGAEWSVGNLLTMSDSNYPGMGSMFAQIWQGDDLIARVYGDTAEEVRSRAARIAAAPSHPSEAKAGEDA